MSVALNRPTDAQLQTEQERVSACLLGFTNSAGDHVWLSVAGMGIPVTVAEQQAYPNLEGAFFGNLFLSTPIQYACQLAWNTQCFTPANCSYSYGRTCATNPASCGITPAGQCTSVCAGGMESCNFGGVTWNSVFRTSISGFCGDYMCNGAETHSNCPSDCLTGTGGGGGASQQL